MKKLYATLSILLLAGVFAHNSFAQQDAQYTQYMYNTLSVNPAYAGARDVFSFVGLYRNQWFNGFEGTPETMTFSVHSPVGEKVGLGLNVVHDQIFITQETYIDLAFSYTIDVSDKAQLAFGLKGGGHLLDINSNRLNTGPFNPGDPDTQIFIDNKFSPQIGAGLYYYTDDFYLGLSAPNVLETKHFDESTANTGSYATAKERVNYYLMSGYVFNVSEDLQFKPAALLKFVEGAPLQVDISANALMYDKLTLGAAYRWSAAISGMVGFQLSDQLMLGFAYDRETTEIQQYNDGSYEVFLRFELFSRKEGLKNPRFF